MDIIRFNEIKKKALDEHIPIIMDDTLEVLDKEFTQAKLNSILEIRDCCSGILLFAFLSI